MAAALSPNTEGVECGKLIDVQYFGSDEVIGPYGVPRA